MDDGLGRGVVLQSGGMRCVLRPDLGGCVAGCWLGAEPALRSMAQVRSARESGCFPLLPFSNRLANARLQWAGRQYLLNANFAPEPHALHGIGWQRAWRLEQREVDRVTLRLEHAADEHWPFDFASEQQVVLEANALLLSMKVTNTGLVPAPAGLGWHPYVVKRPGARVQFRAAGRWETDDRQLPIRRVDVHGLDAPCDLLEVNHAYDGIDGPVRLLDARLHVTITSSLSRLVVSTNPAKDFIALEPVSHTPDSFNRDDASLGTVELRPGESLRARMTLAARPAP